MKKIFSIFKPNEIEWYSIIPITLLSVMLNTLTIYRYFDKFTQITDNYHKLFVSNFHVSGFDPLTYAVVSNWDTEYNVYRHPLLAFFMYIPNLIDQALIYLTGINCVQFVVAVILVLCTIYSYLFLYRIFTEVIEIEETDAYFLALSYFTFAYIMVSMMVPDHFIISSMLLLMTLYISGICMKKGRELTIWQTILLFIFTAGVSLNNGLKTFLAALFTNGKRFFRPKYLLLAVIIPAALIWVCAKIEYKTYVWPKEMARYEARLKKSEQAKAKIYQQYRDTTQVKDSAQVEKAVKAIIKQKTREKYIHDHKQIWNKNTGKPIAKGEFLNWTDISTSRVSTLIENFFGEGIILHADHVLGDVLRDRPVIVEYRTPIPYIVEAIILLGFVMGIIVGRRSKFLWLTLTFFLLDAALHIGLGFGINEVYIMSAHYMYVIPIAIGYLYLHLRGWKLQVIRYCTWGIMIYLAINNGAAISEYMLLQ